MQIADVVHHVLVWWIRGLRVAAARRGRQLKLRRQGLVHSLQLSIGGSVAFGFFLRLVRLICQQAVLVLQLRDVEPVLVHSGLAVPVRISCIFCSPELARMSHCAEIAIEIVLLSVLWAISWIHFNQRWTLRRVPSRSLGSLYLLAVLNDLLDDFLVQAAEALVRPLRLFNLLLVHPDLQVILQLMQQTLLSSHGHHQVFMRDREPNIRFSDQRQVAWALQAGSKPRAVLMAVAFLYRLRVRLPKSVHQGGLQPLNVN